MAQPGSSVFPPTDHAVPDEVAPDDVLLERNRRLRNVQSPAMFLIAAATVATMTVVGGVGLSVYGLIAVSYLGIKLAMSMRYRPSTGDPRSVGTVGAVVPFYNEDPAALRACLESILAQSRPVDRLYVVDDGSDSAAGARVARQVLSASGHPGAVVHVLPENVGKRHAQAWAMRRMDCDIVMTVDSDTVLHPHAVHEGLRAFVDPEVKGVTGNVQAHNADTNLLTRLTSLRYANAFLWERAAYSSVGSVLCACGSLSFWRRDLVERNLEGYTHQTFLGIPVSYGDDRRLTNYALSEGKVLFQETAIAWTTVPDRFTHFARQQLRWNKSFFRETLWALGAFRPWNRVWLLSFAELGLWLAFTVSLIVLLGVYPLLTGSLPSLWYAGFVAAMAFARSVRYLGSQRTSMAKQVGVFLLAPLYGFLYLAVLMPIRFWALFSLRNPGWGTRRKVEVQFQDEGTETSPLRSLSDLDGFTEAPARPVPPAETGTDEGDGEDLDQELLELTSGPTEED
jgi:hyaluronan synthase